jgi:hypothetical protein
MADPVSLLTMTGLGVGAKGAYDALNPDLPDPTPLPAPTEDIDVAGQRQYTKARLKQRKGRASTVLTKLGNNQQGGKPTLG